MVEEEDMKPRDPGDERPKKTTRKVYMIIAIVVVAIVIIAGAMVLSANKNGTKDIRATAVKVTNYNSTSVAIPLSSISQNATWYQYDIDGTSVRFFVVNDSNGGVHTAFDECPYCYPSHQGFRQEGTEMVENCCNMGVQIDQITESSGTISGCHPSPLANQVVDGKVVISISDLAAGYYLFK
jgi:uncharacterized membrane protein